MAAAYRLPCCSHIHIDFVFGAYHPSQPLNEVVITVSDRRRRSLFRPGVLRISRPPFHCSPSLLYAYIQTQTHDYCRRHLNLRACCVDAIFPLLLDTVFTVVNSFHGLPGIIPIELRIFHRSSSSTDHDPHDEEYEREAMRESFEGAAPKPTPASMDSVSKLVEDDMKTGGGDDDWENNAATCTICLDDIETRRSSLKMPCSHVFHQDCIVSWLKNSHLCPLCRYQMPV